MSRSKFDVVAHEYDAGRPGYPDELFDTIEELSGSYLSGSRIADIGAGTGKATRSMVERGARVVAVDHGDKMLSVLRQRTPHVPVLQADANALPFADHSFDLVTFAQSWHWVDLDRAPAEVVRVIRPEGALALWWNTADTSQEQWFAEHRARLQALNTNEVDRRFDSMWHAIPSAFPDLDIETAEVHWQRHVTRDVVLNELRSKSYVVDLGTEGAREFVEREAGLLADAKAGPGALGEAFVVRLAVIRVGAGR
jgi:ubiquinone/menaquinone biosynthesis C-methylase UbiE